MDLDVLKPSTVHEPLPIRTQSKGYRSGLGPRGQDKSIAQPLRGKPPNPLSTGPLATKARRTRSLDLQITRQTHEALDQFSAGHSRTIVSDFKRSV
jgi:hypothetical protein